MGDKKALIVAYNGDPANSTSAFGDVYKMVREHSLLEVLVLDRRDGIDIVLKGLKQASKRVLLCRLLA